MYVINLNMENLDRFQCASLKSVHKTLNVVLMILYKYSNSAYLNFKKLQYL